MFRFRTSLQLHQENVDVFFPAYFLAIIHELNYYCFCTTELSSFFKSTSFFCITLLFSDLLMPHWTDRITILILGFRNGREDNIRDFITFFVCVLDCSVVKHDFWIAFNTFYMNCHHFFRALRASDFGAKVVTSALLNNYSSLRQNVWRFFTVTGYPCFFTIR